MSQNRIPQSLYQETAKYLGTLGSVCNEIELNREREHMEAKCKV